MGESFKFDDENIIKHVLGDPIFSRLAVISKNDIGEVAVSDFKQKIELFLQKEINDDKIDLLFRFYDMNNDGLLAKEEFFFVIRNVFDLDQGKTKEIMDDLEKNWSIYDKDSNGYIDKVEFNQIMSDPNSWLNNYLQ